MNTTIEVFLNLLKINNIRNGLIDLRYLFTPKNKLLLQQKTELYDMQIYNDDATRYSCLLFHKFGIHSLYLLYNGIVGCIDIEAHPEAKQGNSFYFYKEVCIETTSKIVNVDNYGETKLDKKKVWTSCYMGDLLDSLDDQEITSCKYSYISDEDFKYFIKSTLVELFLNRIRRNHDCINKIRDSTFNCEWKKKNERIAMDYTNYTNKLYYLINKQNGCFQRNGKTYVFDDNTDEEKEISLYQQLTPDQVEEYNNFKRDQREDIESLEEETKYYESDLFKIRDLSLSSDTMKSIIQICQFLFEYDEKLIAHYKTNSYIVDTIKITENEFVEENH